MSNEKWSLLVHNGLIVASSILKVYKRSSCQVTILLYLYVSEALRILHDCINLNIMQTRTRCILRQSLMPTLARWI